MNRGDDGLAFLLRYENVAWYEDGIVKILDRRLYPLKTEYVVCHTYKEVAKAITDMVTQSGGPFTAAAMGMAIASYEAVHRNCDYIEYMKQAAYDLSHARPTTSAAMVAITDGALDIALKSADEGLSGKEITDRLQKYAFNYINDKYIRYTRTGRYLAELIPDGGTVMTICFAETVIGTMLRECRNRGKEIHMICSETRPYFQGARLTASVVADMDFDVTVVSDNMAGVVMKTKDVDIFTSAADVITMDGYVVNKVGTFQMALLANYFDIPYYVTGEPSLGHESIDSVKIEERNPEDVLKSMGTKLTLEGVKGYYPAFDITQPELCRGVVTDRGIFRPTDLYKYYKIVL